MCIRDSLGTDHLDVLYTHWQSPDLGLYPLEETVEAMMKLKAVSYTHLDVYKRQGQTARRAGYSDVR